MRENEVKAYSNGKKNGVKVFDKTRKPGHRDSRGV